ncbi:MAG: hypothetical protein ACOY3K_02160 [Candidatus Omnitrophota bacterium]
MEDEPKTYYNCSTCGWSGNEAQAVAKILSIMYRPKHDSIQAFKQIKCPKCHNLVTIIFETLDGTIQSK